MIEIKCMYLNQEMRKMEYLKIIQEIKEIIYKLMLIDHLNGIVNIKHLF